MVVLVQEESFGYPVYRHGNTFAHSRSVLTKAVSMGLRNGPGFVASALGAIILPTHRYEGMKDHNRGTGVCGWARFFPVCVSQVQMSVHWVAVVHCIDDHRRLVIVEIKNSVLWA